MPNWCDTEIKITSSSNLSSFFEKIKDYSDLPSLLKSLEIVDEDLHKRSFLTNVSYAENCISICQQDAWAPCIHAWLKILTKLDIEADLTFLAMEPGIGLFISNDESYIDLYYLDAIDKDELIGFYSEEDLIELLQIELKTKADDLNTLIELALDHQIYIHYIEGVSFSDVD